MCVIYTFFLIILLLKGRTFQPTHRHRRNVLRVQCLDEDLGLSAQCHNIGLQYTNLQTFGSVDTPDLSF